MFPRLVNLRAHFGFVLCSVGFVLGMLSFAATPPPQTRQLAANSTINRRVTDEHLGPINDKRTNQGLASSQAAAGWSLVASPNNAGPNFLSGVTCASASQCWTVGYTAGSGIDDPDQTLIEQWNGTSWSIVFSPNTEWPNYLSGVTCTSASDCWTVGYYDSLSNGLQTLIQHWDGTSWTITGPANQNGLLISVTCASASQCWAVGYYNNGHRQTLIEQWDGNAWTAVSSPNTSSTQTNYLNAVTCASASECWAVGYYNNGTADQTLIEQWNGTSWTIVSSPSSSPTQKNHVEGVACASASDCWAVGYYVNGSGFQQPLIEQWNGSSWAIVSSPNVSATQNNYFYGVTCASSLDCWAVGNYSNGSSSQTFIGQWTGGSWSTVASPSTSATQDNQLVGVTCVSPSQCWTVGSYTNDSGYAQTLIEEYTASPLQITSVSGPTNGHFTIMGQSPPSISINIQVSPDLVTPFATFATVTSDANGVFEYDDGSAGMALQRFYEASYQ